MKEVIEGILAKHRAKLRKVGIFNPTVATQGSSLYQDDCTASYYHSVDPMVSMSTLRMHDLFGCCGVIELNRPSGYHCSQQEFNAVMDVVMEGLRSKADPRTNPFELWGNQILATTSSESYQYLRPYLVARRWRKFSPAREPTYRE